VQILEFCAEDPVERVFLEDVARRRLGRFSAFADNGRLTALCHVGANVVPSGADCGRFAEAAARGRARMIIGHERAVDELWDDLAGLMPTPRNDRPGQPYTRSPSRRLQGTPDSGRRPTRTSRYCCPRARPRTKRRSGSIRWRGSGGLPLAHALSDRGRTLLALGRGRHDSLQGGGVGVDAGRGAGATGLGGSAGAAQRVRAARNADLCRLLLQRVPTVCLFVRPENQPAIRVYEAIGMQRHGFYRSLIF